MLDLRNQHNYVPWDSQNERTESNQSYSVMTQGTKLCHGLNKEGKETNAK